MGIKSAIREEIQEHPAYQSHHVVAVREDDVLDFALVRSTYTKDDEYTGGTYYEFWSFDGTAECLDSDVDVQDDEGALAVLNELVEDYQEAG